MTLRSLFATSLAALLVGCVTKPDKPKEPAKPVAPSPQLVGIVASVPSDKRFVLIRSYGKWDATTGQIVTTRGPDGRAANLRVTGEKLGEFSAADVQAGTAEIGDAVYSQPVAETPKPSPSPVPLPEPSTPVGPAPKSEVLKNI
jgi:hypothetical protein